MPKLGSQPRLTSPVQEDYLKALLRLSDGDDNVQVPTSRLAEELALSPGSVSEMLSKLAALQLVVLDPYRGARLAPAGRAVALEMVRHHRLIETYLVRALGYRLDEVHEEAELLEHAISERLEERMWEALGRPAFDPHGDPIPSPDFVVVEPETVPLPEVAEGASVQVSRISDRDSAKLRALEELGLTPGRALRVLAASLWEGPIVVAAGDETLQVPLGLARAVRVEPVP